MTAALSEAGLVEQRLRLDIEAREQTIADLRRLVHAREARIAELERWWPIRLRQWWKTQRTDR